MSRIRGQYGVLGRMMGLVTGFLELGGCGEAVKGKYGGSMWRIRLSTALRGLLRLGKTFQDLPEGLPGAWAALQESWREFPRPRGRLGRGFQDHGRWRPSFFQRHGGVSLPTG